MRILLSISLIALIGCANNQVKEASLPEIRSVVKKYEKHPEVWGFDKTNERNGHAIDSNSIYGKSYNDAFEYTLSRAKLGYGEHQYKLGRMYEYGIGIEKNLVKASTWYMLAMKNNYKDAKLRYEKLRKELTKNDIKEAHDDVEIFVRQNTID